MREQLQVPAAEVRSYDSYYGRQILKTPTWKTPDVPLYLFLGGMGGASALLAEGAAITGNEPLEHLTRLVAAGSAATGTVFLIHDLGRPERFLNMLRVIKLTSPLSVGSFILAPFASLSGAAAASQVTGRLPRLGRLAGAASTLFAAPLATYTAALISNTAVPVWHGARHELPFVFAGSGAAAAGGLAMAVLPTAASEPAWRMAVAGAGLELAAATTMERRLGMVAEPYHQGFSGRLMKAARACTLGATALAVTGRGSRTARALAGAGYVAGSVLTRFAVFEAGLASARDPKYTVVPQRERKAQREAAEAH
jgi:hypothetical protein